MEIIHISGTQCSGKSFVINQFLKRADTAHWDILNYYIRKMCIVDGYMDWSKWDEARHGIVSDLESFFITNFKDKHCFIESGSNSTVYRYLHEKVEKKYKVHHIQLKTPTKEVLSIRAIERGLRVEQVMEFRTMFLNRYAHSSIKSYTQDEAITYIASLIGGSNVLEQEASEKHQDS